MGKKEDILNRIYPAKIILFGEYTVLVGSDVLAAPVHTFYGKWSRGSQEYADVMDAFLDYLTIHGFEFLNLQKLCDWIAQGYAFVSDIPSGCGLGSSGALTAAVYELCSADEVVVPGVLQKRLALMESFFHGTSSGLDPLVSLLNKAIHKRPDGQVMFIETTVLTKGCEYLRLYDSQLPRKSKDLVPIFFNLVKTHKEILELLISTTGRIIKSLTAGRSIGEDFKRISARQLEMMKPMIPDSVSILWEQGLRTGDFALKLCGSGGGGYFLCYTESGMNSLNGYDLIPINFHNS